MDSCRVFPFSISSGRNTISYVCRFMKTESNRSITGSENSVGDASTQQISTFVLVNLFRRGRPASASELKYKNVLKIHLSELLDQTLDADASSHAPKD